MQLDSVALNVGIFCSCTLVKGLLLMIWIMLADAAQEKKTLINGS